MSLALNYEPEVVVNIETLTREEWLDYRRLGMKSPARCTWH